MTETKAAYATRPPVRSTSSTGSPQAAPGVVRRSGPPAPPAGAIAAPRAAVQFTKPSATAGHRVVLYGPGGIGKTTLASQMKGRSVFFDLDESLSKLGIDAPTVRAAKWGDIRTALQSPGWDGVDNIHIDTGTRAEELAVVETLSVVPACEKGQTWKAKSIEDYGWGKGYSHVFDTFMGLLFDLDVHARAGRNVVLICHDCTSNVPNPAGEDWLRYEPRLQNPASGKASIRLRVREWADHVLFIGYDVSVGKDGKGRGIGTRTLYPAELPHCMAKSRTCGQAMAVGSGQDGGGVWEQIIR